MSEVSKRDYFATKTMQAMIASIDSESTYQRLKHLANGKGLTVSQWIAKEAYKQADAMMEESQC